MLLLNHFVFQQGTPLVWHVESTDPLRLGLVNTKLTQKDSNPPPPPPLSSLRKAPEYDFAQWVTEGSLWVRLPSQGTAPPYAFQTVVEVTSVAEFVHFRNHSLTKGASKPLLQGGYAFMRQHARLSLSLEDVSTCPALEALLPVEKPAPKPPQTLFWVIGRSPEVPLQAVFKNEKEAKEHLTRQACLLGLSRRQLKVVCLAAGEAPPMVASLLPRIPDLRNSQGVRFFQA